MKYTFLLRSASIFIFALLFFGAAGSAYAVDRCWDGGGSTNNWSEDANWASDTEPGTGDVAVFDNGTCSGTPNKNATIDGAIDVQGINIVAYSGTISISSTNSLTLGSSGFVQAAGAFDIATGTVLSSGTFNRTGGTFDGGSGTYPSGAYIHTMTSSTLTGSTTFYHLAFVTYFGAQTDNVDSGTTLTVEGKLLIDGSFDSNDVLNGPGGISAQGDIEVDGYGFEGATTGTPGDVVITINGTGSQNLIGESDTDSQIPSLAINKSTGALSITDTIVVGGGLAYSQGTISPGSSTIIFELNGNYTYSGTYSLNNVTFRSALSNNTGPTISSGTITALGNLTFDGTFDNNDTLSGPGTLTIQGNLSTVTNGIDSNVAITLTGTNSQSINLAGALFTTGTLTINKSSGTVTLGAALTLDGTGQDLVISSGILDMSTYALTVDDVTTLNGGLIQGSGNFTASNGNMTIGATGWWVNNSTGDIDAEGGDTITNNGYVRWDGASAGCGGTDDIALTRNGSGSVSLAGSGRWRVYDITIGTTGIYDASPALTIYSSSITGSQTGITNNGTCPSEVTWDGGGGDTNYNTGANWTGDTAPGATDLAVLDATSTKAMTINTDPADNGFQINLGYSGTMTQSNGVDITLDDQGWEQNAGTFTGGDATSDIDFNNGGDLTFNAGIYTTPAGIITVKDNWTIAGGTFTASSGTVKFWADVDNTATITGNGTFNNVLIHDESFGSNRTITVASGTTLTTNGSLTLYSNQGYDVLNGPGGISAKGNINLQDSGWYYGDIVITINGDGSQTLDGEGDSDTHILSTVISKSSGTLTITDTIVAANDWTYTQGTISPGSSTVLFRAQTDDAATITGSHTLANIGFYDNSFGADRTITVAAGTTLTATGNLSLDTNGGDTVNGPGGVTVQGNITSTDNGWTGTLPITLSGTNAQSITHSATNFPTGTLTINKSSNTVTLASAFSLSGSGQDLTITDGTLANSSYALTVNDAFTINDTFTQGTGNVSAASYTVGASANWTNTSTGDVTIGTGGVANSGTITLGDINTCGGTNNIAITSSSGGNQRSWSGSGDFNIYDVTVQDQGGSASITAYSSQNVSGNDTNWTFDNVCPSVEVQGVRLQGGNVRLRGGTKVL